MDNRLTLRNLLEITGELVAEIGCQKTTLQEIIRRSGISKGAIYHYVQSKDELFGFILQAHMEKKVDHHYKADASQGTYNSSAPNGSSRSLGPLSVIVHGLLQPANEKQVVLRRCFIYLLSKQEQPDVSKILQNLNRSWSDFTAAWIEACQSRGMIPPHIHAYQTAAFIISVLFGLMVQKSITEGHEEESEKLLRTDTVLQMFSVILEINIQV